MPKSLAHTHIYVRWKKNHFGEIWFKCDDPRCYHVIQKSRVQGKSSICSICREKEFVLTREDLRRAQPRCPDCSNTKAAREKRVLKSTVQDILKDVLDESPIIS